ncbi:hypothetical protein HYPSUDRAFT_216446, partial [Hypholoma sublateritium FD-334 SS-4]
MSPSSLHLRALLFLLIISNTLHNITVRAYTWTFLEAPTQCGVFAINIFGSDGIPPFRVLVIPYGPSPLDNVEVRNIIDMQFTGNSSQVQFQLPYPTNSQLVAVVSDATGFGSGGTSAPTTVAASNDSSCFNPTSPASYDFYFAIDPENQLVQCQDMRIFWDPSLAQGNPSFLGVIPGGQSFTIPQDTITTVVSLGTGFNWTPSLRGGTTFVLIGGDARGSGTAGMWQSVVTFGINDITSCLSDNSPSSTAGPPAGGTATSTSETTPTYTSTPTPTTTSPELPTSSGSAKGSKTVIEIASGVAGTLALIILVILLLCLQRRSHARRQNKQRPIDLTAESSPPRPAPSVQQSEPTLQFQPQPPAIPVNERIYSHNIHLRDAPSSLPSTSTRSTTSERRIYAGTRRNMSTQGKGQKSDAQRVVRGTILVQHEDAGPSMPGPTRDPVMVEIPPAYTELRLAAVAGRR